MSDGLPLPQRIWAYATILVALTMAVLDGSIVNVALPSMAHDLNIDAAEAIWIVNAYQLTVTMSLLALSSLGDIKGYKLIYLGGLTLFTLASLLCALSTSQPMLVAARALQGFGAAGVMSVNLAMVRFIIPSRLLGRAIGITALTVAVSSALGPTIASAILSVATWPWLFLVNLPLGVIAITIGLRTLPTTTRSGAAFDFGSAALSAVTFGLFIIGADQFGHSGGTATALAMMAGAALSATWLTRRQLSLPLPLLPVDLLKIPVFALSMATSICSFSAQMLAYISLPFYFQYVLGRTAVETGLLMTPWPIAVALVAPLAGLLSDSFTPARLGAIGLAVMTLGLALLLFLPAQPATADIAWRLVVCGIGFGLFQTPNNKAIITSAPVHRSGGASGMQATARLVGQSTGAAIAAIIFNLTGVMGQMPVALMVAIVLTGCGAITSAMRRFEKGAG
jgi:DHA2 family multidrug resistance protein-like MFS transporter